MTPPLSAVGDRNSEGLRAAPVSQRRQEVAHLAGLQVAPVPEEPQPAAPAQARVTTESCGLWSDDSDLTELSEDSEAEADTARAQSGVPSSGQRSPHLGDNGESSQPPPASLQTHQEIITPTQTFRKMGRHKRGRSADDTGGQDSSDESLPEDKGDALAHIHSKARKKASGKAKRKRPIASDAPRPKINKPATKRPGKEPLRERTQLTSNLPASEEERDVTLEDFLPPAPSPPPSRSSEKRDLKKKAKRSTAEWMSSANVKLVERRMQSTEPLAAASTDDEARVGPSVGGNNKERMQDRPLGRESATRDGNDLRNKDSAKDQQDLGHSASVQSSAVDDQEGAGTADADGDQQQHDIMDLQVQAVEEGLAPIFDSDNFPDLLEPDRRQSPKETDGKTGDPPSSPSSPSQIALERQQSRHAVSKDHGTAQNAPAPPADLETSAQTTVQKRQSRSPPAPTRPRKGAAEAVERSKLHKGRRSQACSKEEIGASPGSFSSGDDSEADKAAPPAQAGNMSTAPKVANSNPPTLADAEPSSDKKGSGAKQSSPGERAKASSGSRRITGKAPVASRRAVDLGNTTLPCSKASTGRKKAHAPSAAAEAPSELVSDEGLNLVLPGNSSDGVFTGGDDPVPTLAGPLDRDELEQHLVKGMNGLRAVYKALAKSGFSDDIDDFEDPACDQKSSSVLALESAARTTLKLGQFLYDLATKKDECERRERDEINRRKISDKVDVMSERLQGVLNEAGDVIQVLQSVDAWVNRHERGDTGGKRGD